MTFKSLKLPLSLDTSFDNPADDLFEPVLSLSVKYNIGVGYFTPNWFRDVAKGIVNIALNKGNSKWIISPQITENDLKVLSKLEDYGKQLDYYQDISKLSFEQLFESLNSDIRLMMAWLIRDGIVDFRIGISKEDLTSVFHPKMGVFVDSKGSKIAFSGSYNLTKHASTNWVTIEIYCDWQSDEAKKRIDIIEKRFERIWSNNDPNLGILKPKEIVFEKYYQLTEKESRPYKLINKDKEIYVVPKWICDDEGKIRDYQEDAISRWFKNNGKGIFNLATGSGKTITALAAATKLSNHVIKENSRLVIVVLVPFIHLADQWFEEAQHFGFIPIRCYGNASSWKSDVQRELSVIDISTGILMLITVNKTFSLPPFQAFLSRVTTNIMLIADEMHNLGSPKLLKALPQEARFRLGLSATPERFMDEIGTQDLYAYFGDIVAEFTLKDAVDRDFLCKYYYYPVIISLTIDEMEEYKEISKKIAKMLYRKSGISESDEDILSLLYIKRSRLIGAAKNKLPELAKILREKKNDKYILVYCGDKQDEDGKFTEKLTRLIGNEIGMKVNKFTSEESGSKRKKLLKSFGNGSTQVLVSIRCLDEGVDVPRTETAFILASSVNPRQFVQRRGRVLRKAEGKKYAHIYDFIVAPSLDQISEETFNVERNLLRRELGRVSEFAKISLNPHDASDKLRNLKKKLNLLDS